MNQTLTSGIYKTLSKGMPIFKRHEVSSISNYRPIYLFPPLYKSFEYVIFDQFTDYLIKNNIFCSEKLGFWLFHRISYTNTH